jgi:hypothetical protein
MTVLDRNSGGGAPFLIAALAALATACAEPAGWSVPDVEAAPGDGGGLAAARPEDLLITRSATTAAQAREQVFQPRADTPEWRWSLPVDWAADPFGDANWRFQLHAWRPVAPLLVEHARAPDTDDLQAVLTLAMDWADWHRTGREADYSWDDMATGLRASKLAWLLSEARSGGLRPDEREWSALLGLAQAHADRLSEDGFIQLHNHGIFAAHGLMALCGALPEMSGCDDRAALAADWIGRLFDQQFTDDYVHAEHSPFYHWFAIAQFERLARTGWYEAVGLETSLDRARDAAPWLLHADGREAGVGDTDRRRRAEDARRVPSAAQACPGEPAEDCVIVRHLPATGYTLVRSPADAPEEAAHSLFFTCGHHSNVHKHADDASFEWFAFGALILADTGKYGFTHDAFREFALSRPAHSTLVFDNERRSGVFSRPRDFPGSCASAPEKRPDGAVILGGSVDHAGPDAVHHRQMEYRPSRSLEVRDRVETRRARPFTQWHHFGPRVDVREAGDGRFIASLEGVDTVAVESDTRCAASLHRGETDPIQGWISTDYEIMEPRWSLAVRCPGTVSEVTARFDVLR